MESAPVVGVIGGMGPYAGLDLVHKIFDQTVADRDQDHLPVRLLSYAHRIEDRTAYLLGEVDENPAIPITALALDLIGGGATVLGIPCNSAHAAPIFEVIRENLHAAGHGDVILLHMIEEAVRHVRVAFTDVRRIGVLSTLSTFRLGIYANVLEAEGFDAVLPDENVQHIVHRAIYDPGYGIKAKASPVTQIARQGIVTAVAHLKQKGAEAIILGCSELPLAIPEAEVDDLPVIDPNVALARAFIRHTYPDKLKPL